MDSYEKMSDFIAWRKIKVSAADVRKGMDNRCKTLGYALHEIPFQTLQVNMPICIVAIIVDYTTNMELWHGIDKWYELSQSKMYRNMISHLWTEMYKIGLTLPSISCCKEVLFDIEHCNCLNMDVKHLYKDMIIKRICYGALDQSVASLAQHVIRRLFAYRTKHKAYWKKNFLDRPYLQQYYDYQTRFLGIIQTDFKEIKIILKLVRDVINIKKQNKVFISSFPSSFIPQLPDCFQGSSNGRLLDLDYENSELRAFEKFLQDRKFFKHYTKQGKF